MEKSMARIQNGVVVNIEWVSDNTVETNDLKNIYDLHVQIGDSYSNSRFYRNGDRILSFRERVSNMLTSYDTALIEIEAVIPSSFNVINAEIPDTFEGRKQKVLTYLTALIEGGTE